MHGFDLSTSSILLKIDIHVRYTMMHVWNNQVFFKIIINSLQIVGLAIFCKYFLCLRFWSIHGIDYNSNTAENIGIWTVVWFRVRMQVAIMQLSVCCYLAANWHLMMYYMHGYMHDLYYVLAFGYFYYVRADMRKVWSFCKPSMNPGNSTTCP